MADRRSLGMLGFVFGGITAAVMMTAVLVTKHHLHGRLPHEAGMPIIAAMAQTAAHH